MFEDEKIRLIESLPEADTILIIWVKLLAQAGKTNASGYIYLSENIPFTDEMLSTIFNRPIGTVRLALKTFEQFGMIEISDNHFISIANWDKHQNIDGLNHVKEQSKLRMRKTREKRKLMELGYDEIEAEKAANEIVYNRKRNSVTEPVTNVTQHVTQRCGTDIDIDIDIDIDKERDIKTNNNIISEITTFWDLNGFGLNNINSKEKLLKFLDEGLDGPVILKALEIAVDMNKVSYSYVEKILNNWISRGVTNIQDVQALQKEYELQKKKRTGKTKSTRTEVIPEWYDQPEPQQEQLTPEAQAKQKALEEKLKKFKKEPSR
jgi:predicted phage replisome organizer